MFGECTPLFERVVGGHQFEFAEVKQLDASRVRVSYVTIG